MTTSARRRLAFTLLGLAACGGQAVIVVVDDGGGSGAQPAPTTTPSASGTGSVPTPVPIPIDAAPPPPPKCHGCIDAGHDAGTIVKGNGGCPASCVLEPPGVPPCASPERTCDCKAVTYSSPTCTPVPGQPGLSCCS